MTRDPRRAFRQLADILISMAEERPAGDMAAHHMRQAASELLEAEMELEKQIAR